MEKKKTAIIIGAGPAGLTAAYELLGETDIKPIIFEATQDIGGISKTVNYKGNRIDIGGHRFFSKSDKITNWWLNILPLEESAPHFNQPLENRYSIDSLGRVPQGGRKNLSSENIDNIMLVRSRLSRIFFLRKFFDYPVSLSLNTIKNLGFIRMFKIGTSYIKASLSPRKEKSLEDFFINRFGEELYETFFKDYTQKVWGVPCAEIKPEWGAQRIKGLSVTKTLLNAFKKIFIRKQNLSQKNQETSLIDQFMYPKFGPGFMWETVAKVIKEKGGEVNVNQKVIGVNTANNKITSVMVQDTQTNEIKEHNADYVLSSMSVKELVESLKADVPSEVSQVAQGLLYRDFITVGLLLNKTNINLPDNWIYIQERDVKLGRLQVFNNWSPYMVQNKENIWLGLEYFCNEGDELWTMQDDKFSEFAIEELAKIDIIEKEDVIDSVVIRMPKAYPAYFGTYDKFDIVKNYLDTFENLFLIGRNGMHRYNNMDHSMLSAMAVVDNILSGIKSKTNIWGVNVEEDYHETK